MEDFIEEGRFLSLPQSSATVQEPEMQDSRGGAGSRNRNQSWQGKEIKPHMLKFSYVVLLLSS